MPLRLHVPTPLVLMAIIGGLFAARGEATSLQSLFAEKGCVGCHGEDGRQSVDAIPVLAGQNAEYLFRQMKDVAIGRRVAGPGVDGQPRTAAMKDSMSGVDDAEMRTLADWLATVPPPAPMPGDPVAAAEGAELFEEFGCAGCHGVDGLKPLTGYPILAGQNQEYLVLQTKEIRGTMRTNGRSRVMVEFVHKVSDAQVERIATYLSLLSRTATSP